MTARKARYAESVTFALCTCGESDCDVVWITFRDKSGHKIAIGEVGRGELSEYVAGMECLPEREGQTLQ